MIVSSRTLDPREIINRAVRCEEEGRLDDAVLAWLEIARLVSGYPQAYERLFAIHVHRREVDAAFCAASVLASLDALEGMARELYEDYLPRRLPPRASVHGLDAQDWALLRHPLEDPAMGDRLGAIVPKLKLKPASADAIDMATFAWAAQTLGASADELPRDAAPPVVAGEDLDQIWGNYTLRERLFFAGRAATPLRVPAHGLARATVQQIAGALGESRTEEIERWAAGVVLTRARAGKLVCGEPAVAHQLITRESTDEAVLGELALFAVSPEHHRLRAKLGIAIGMSADAPQTPAPLPSASSAASPTPSVSASPTPAVSASPAPSASASASPSPSASSASPRLVAIVDAIVQAPEPPRTVRDLERALGFTLTDANLEAVTQPGDLVIRAGLPPPVAGVGLKWKGETIPRSAEALRGRALASGWHFDLTEGRAYVDARLCARFDVPREYGKTRHEYTSKSGVYILSWLGPGEKCSLGFAVPPVEPRERSWVVEYAERATARRAEEIAEAEREALASGKQPFDYAYLRKRCPIGDEATARYDYLVLRRELRTLDEYAAHLTEQAVWDGR